MAVQTVGFEFTAKDTGMQEAFSRMKKGMRDLGLAADSLRVSKIGDDAKIALDVTGKSIKEINIALQNLKMMFIDTSIAGEKLSNKPFTQMNKSVKELIGSLKEANNLSTMFGKASLLGGTPKATVRATGNAEIKAIQTQLNTDLAKAQKDFEESSTKDKKAYDAQIKTLYAQSAADILAIVRKTQAELTNLTSREGTVKLGQTNTKEFLAKLQQDILKINTTQRYGLDSREKAVVDNARKELAIRQKLAADLLKEQTTFEASSTSSSRDYLKTRVNLEKKAAQEIKDINKLTVRAAKFIDKAGTYESGFATDVRNLQASYKQQAAIAKEGANSLQALQRKVAEERLRIETKLAADVKAVEDKTFVDLMSGAKNTASGQLTILRKYYSDALKEVEKGEAAILAKIIVEVKKAEQAKKATAIGNFQQQLQNESNQKLALLEAGYLREKAVRDKGAASIQARQAEIAEKRIKLEQDTAKELERIQSLTGKKASLGGLSLAEAGRQSKEVIKLRHEGIDALNKESAAIEKTKSAHMNLTSFIGTSMIIWRSYNFVLGQTTSLLQAIPKVGMELDSTVSVLQATMGGSAGAVAGLKALEEEAQRTGISIIALRENWRTFSASTILAGESMETAWKMFSNVNTVVTALHYSGDKATHIFMALSQMFNKSKVQSEELVKQLGNLLPAAYGVFAKSMNLTTIQLAQQMKKGMVMAHDTLPQFLAEYEERFKVSFARASHSLNAEVGRMQNSFTLLGEAIYKSTEKDMVSAVKSLGKFADALTNNLDTLGRLGNSVIAFGEAIVAWKIWSQLGKLKLFGELLWKLKGGLLGIAATATGIYFFNKYESLDSTKLSEAIGKVQTFGEKVKELPKEINIKVDIETDEALIALREAGKTIKAELAKLKTATTLKAQIDNIPVKDIEGRVALLNEARRLRKEKGLNPEDAISLPKFTETVDKATGKTILEQTGTFLGTESDRQKIIKQLEDFAKQQNDLTEKYIEEQTALKAKSIQQLILDDKTLETLQKQHYGAIKDLDERESVRRKDEMEEALKLNATKIELARNVVAQYEEALKTATTEKDKDFNKAQLITANETLAKFTTAKLEIEQGYQNDIARIKERSIKKDEELAKKQIELAKKTASDLKEIADQTAERELQDIDKKLKALEKVQDEKSIGDYHREEISLIDEKIAALERQLVAVKALNAEQQVTTAGGITTDFSLLNQRVLSKKGEKDVLVPTMLSYLQSLGLSKEKASAFVATGLAESNLQTDATSSDGYKMRGMFQWDTTRRKTFKDLYRKDIAEATLKEQIDYGIWELTSNDKRAIAQSGEEARALFAKSGLSVEEASKAMVFSERPADIAGATAHRTKLANRLFKNYSGVEAGNLDTIATANSEILKLEKEKQTLEEQKLVSLEKQSEQYKQVQKDINNIHAEYKLYTGEVEKGTEELFAERHSKLIERLNLELKDLTITQEQYNETLKAKNELDKIGEIQAQKFASARAMKALGKEEKSIDKQIATISQMESLSLLDPISAMMQRSALKSNSLIPSLQKQQAELERRDQSIMPDEEKEATIAKIEEIQTKLLELSATANESFTFTANMVSSAFDTTFRGILDGTIKGKDAFKEFGKSILKTMQELVLQAIKSQIVGLILKGLGSFGGSMAGGVDAFSGGATSSLGINMMPSSNGNVFQFEKGGIAEFAKGGLASILGFGALPTMAKKLSKVSPVAGAFLGGGGAVAASNPTFKKMLSPSSMLFDDLLPFEKGGIPDIGNRFETFQMANGAAGSLREQGKYEAIMPLKRTANGELGVIAGGAVASNDQRQYNINVTVAGGADETNASDIGHKIAIATMEKIADTRIANASRVGNSLNRTTSFGGR